jgi:flavin reductase (DIM6/NTAB) family NADH-FMN oxidoreductase RutF
VVTSAWHGQANTMVAATAMRASILSDRPRMIILIWKANYTHQLIEQSRAFAVHLLGPEQLPLVRAFGFDSGQERNKLAGVPYETRVTGSPILTETLAYLDCRMVGSLDGGDLTCYLANVVDGARLRHGEVMIYRVWQANIAPEWKPDYEPMLARQMTTSRAYFESQRCG